MTKRMKLLPVWIAISSVIIIAGIVLYILFGFNTSAEVPSAKYVEVKYDTVVTIGQNTEEELQTLCENTFTQNGISYEKKRTYEVTGGGVLEYIFASETSVDKLNQARETITEALNDASGIYADADTYVTVHTATDIAMNEPAWRGAIALGVAAIVALVYIAIRFRIACALTALIACVNDVFVTLGIFVICRIPVYGYAPLLFAGIAMAVSLILWLVQCMKMRENFKDPSYRGLSAAEAVAESGKTAWKTVVAISATLAIVIALFGGLATAGVRLFFLPALIPVAVSTYSSLVLAPAVHAQMKNVLPAVKKKKNYEGAKSTKEIAVEE